MIIHVSSNTKKVLNWPKEMLLGRKIEVLFSDNKTKQILNENTFKNKNSIDFNCSIFHYSTAKIICRLFCFPVQINENKSFFLVLIDKHDGEIKSKKTFS